MFTLDKLVQDIRRLGLDKGDSVVVHASYKSIGPVSGGPLSVLQALRETVLPGRALLFPNLYIPRGFTQEDPPYFRLKTESVRKLGILPAMFKFQLAKVFSIHPTHSMMGIGEKAEGILQGHELAGVPCGPGTPWYKNAGHGGKVLLIGVDQRCNTTYHCAEEQLADSYRLTKEVIKGVVEVDGQEIIVPSRLHLWGPWADFNRINNDLEKRGALVKGKLGHAECMCLQAQAFIELGLQKLKGNRRFFL